MAHAKQRKQKKTVQQLLKSRRRDQRKKGQRLARRALTEMVARRVANTRTYASVVAVRRPDAEKGPEILFGMRTGLFGHPTTTTLRVKDEQIVGAVEDVKELGEIVTQVGLLTLAALVNYNLAWGPEGLAKALARWACIDLTELEKRAEAEEAAERAELEAAAAAAQAEADAELAALEPADGIFANSPEYCDEPQEPDEQPEAPVDLGGEA